MKSEISMQLFLKLMWADAAEILLNTVMKRLNWVQLCYVLLYLRPKRRKQEVRSKIKKQPFSWAHKRPNRKCSDGGKTVNTPKAWKSSSLQADSTVECERSRTYTLLSGGMWLVTSIRSLDNKTRPEHAGASHFASFCDSWVLLTAVIRWRSPLCSVKVVSGEIFCCFKLTDRLILNEGNHKWNV